MNSLGLVGFLAALLQLTVPSYALRLIRRFGAERVGWFIVTSFACLGMLHLLDPLRSAKSSSSIDIIYVIGSALLLIGMAHVDSLVSARQQAVNNEKKLHRQIKREIEEQISALETRNQELTGEIASCAQRLKALEDSEAQYRFLFIQNPQPMWIIDLRTGGFLAINKIALEQSGYSQQEILTLGASALVLPEAREAFLKNMISPSVGVTSRGRWHILKKGGSTAEVEISAVDLKYADCPARLLLLADTASHRREEQDLLERERVKLVGKIAGGVAHHFNNILTIISGQTDLMLQSSPTGDAAQKLRQVSAAVHRGSCITRQLLAAGGQQMIDLVPMNLADSLQKLNPTLQRVLGNSISLLYTLAPDLPPVMGDARALENILVALVLNARDAISGKGTVTLGARAVHISEAQARGMTCGTAGDYVCIMVRDNGCGMSPEVLAGLYEPFFTTKEVGKATGLGLASAYGLAQQQGGWIETTSEVQKGTEVKLYLPRSERAPAATPSSVSAATATGRTVLLIEPDDRARALGRHILNRHGYGVIESDSPEIAMSLWESEISRIDLVLTELALPSNVSGLKLAKRFQSAKPGLKIMFASDSTEKIQNFPEKDLLITKPYQRDVLMKYVEDCFAES